MSSATLTDVPRRERRAARRAPSDPVPPPPTAPASGLRPWHFFLVGSTLVATVAVIAMHGQPVERILLAVATVASAGYAGHALHRTLAPLVTEGAGEDATMVSGRTRAALERDKMLTLRAIKELEFDRAMGKVADGDFTEMRDRLRARALRLISQLDGASAYREMIERDLAARLPARTPGGAPAVTAGAATTAPAPAPARPFCTGCGTANEPDARFCKMCGQALQVTA